MRGRREHYDSGWDERDALRYWAELCGPTAIDRDIFRFILNEVSLHGKAVCEEWQSTLCNLIGFILKHSMPMELLNPRPSYQQETRQARNAEEALLAALNACARVTQNVSRIEWPSSTSQGEWLNQLRGQRAAYEYVLSLSCLSYLNMRNCMLSLQDLALANLNDARLDGARLNGARLNGANLNGASLFRASLFRASLDGAIWTDGRRVLGRDENGELIFENPANEKSEGGSE